jgi:hypothetical protein
MKQTRGIFLLKHENPTFQINIFMLNTNPEKITDNDINLILCGLEHEYLHYALFKLAMKNYHKKKVYNELIRANQKLDNLYSMLGIYKR